MLKKCYSQEVRVRFFYRCGRWGL